MLEPVLQELSQHSQAAPQEEFPPICITQLHETKFSGRINDKIFRHSTDMCHDKAGPHHELDYKVAITDSP